MLKKVALVVVAGSLVFAAQAVSADDTQYDEDGRWIVRSIASPVPMNSMGDGDAASRGPATQAARFGQTERTSGSFELPAPYNVPGGYHFD